jgi:peptidyl-prolyl cis-trans isomerase A (cyclophilin A)
VRRRGAARAALIGVVAASVASCGYSPFACKPEAPPATAAVPDSFVIAFHTSRGRFDAMAHRDWSPTGAWRLYELVNSHFYDGDRFFRVVKGFVAQFGLSGDPALNAAWKSRCIADEPVRHTNARGTMAFARGGANTRAVQLYVNLKDNPKLDTLSGFGFPPVAEVISGMQVVDSLYAGYGEAAPRSGSQYGMEGPSQDSIAAQGQPYLQRGWPKLDYIDSARVVQRWP